MTAIRSSSPTSGSSSSRRRAATWCWRRTSTIVAVSDAYLRATMTKRDEHRRSRRSSMCSPTTRTIPAPTGVANLRASLERVLAHARPDAMAVQKYDIRRPESEGGGFEERHWSPVNSPVLGEDGAVAYVIHARRRRHRGRPPEAASGRAGRAPCASCPSARRRGTASCSTRRRTRWSSSARTGGSTSSTCRPRGCSATRGPSSSASRSRC